MSKRVIYIILAGFLPILVFLTSLEEVMLAGKFVTALVAAVAFSVFLTLLSLYVTAPDEKKEKKTDQEQ